MLAAATIAVLAVGCTIRHRLTFDELSESLSSAAGDARASQSVESDLRYGSRGEWALVVVGRDGFDSRAAVSQGLAEADAARITDLVMSLTENQYLVGITPHAVSYVEVPDELCALGSQRVVVANGEGWVGFTIEGRTGRAPVLTDFRLLDGPREP